MVIGRGRGCCWSTVLASFPLLFSSLMMVMTASAGWDGMGSDGLVDDIP